jgi:hypothetical protein
MTPASLDPHRSQVWGAVLLYWDLTRGCASAKCFRVDAMAPAGALCSDASECVVYWFGLGTLVLVVSFPVLEK